MGAFTFKKVFKAIPDSVKQNWESTFPKANNQVRPN